MKALMANNLQKSLTSLMTSKNKSPLICLICLKSPVLMKLQRHLTLRQLILRSHFASKLALLTSLLKTTQSLGMTTCLQKNAQQQLMVLVIGLRKSLMNCLLTLNVPLLKTSKQKMTWMSQLSLSTKRRMQLMAPTSNLVMLLKLKLLLMAHLLQPVNKFASKYLLVKSQLN